MLNQATHWIEYIGTAVDALLLCRVLFLRLNRVYLFITLGCVLTLFFDATTLLLRGDAQGDFRVFLYSRFLYAVVYPLVAWDVFEEVKSQIGKLRRFAATRLVSGLFFAIIFGLVMGALFEGNDAETESSMVVTLALVLWAGATTACLAFLFTIHRVVRSQPLQLPNNTQVWVYFYELSFAAEALYCFFTVLLPTIHIGWVSDTVSLAFMMFGIVITGWCILKLRPVPSGISPVTENARLG